jgi:hypothetical protein
MSISVLAISFDAHNAAELAQFWAQALHRTVNDGATEDFASIAADTDSRLGPLLMFHKVPEGKTVKNRVHFDLEAAEVLTEADKPGRQADPLTCREQQPVDQLPRPRRQRVRLGGGLIRCQSLHAGPTTFTPQRCRSQCPQLPTRHPEI